MSKTIFSVVILIILIAVGFYFYANNATAPESSTNNLHQESNQEKEIITQDVEYFEGVTGYLARPAGNDSYPGIVLIHEWWGLNEDIKSIARRFASEGYVALAVDMYNGAVTTESSEARTLSSNVRNDVEGAFKNLKAAVEYLKSRPEVEKEKLASVGWCFGGGWSYQMALNDLGTNASVMYYGQFSPEDDFDHMRSSILGHFGENDASITVDNVREFQARLETANGSHEVYIYPNVGHGFANERGGDNTGYSEEAAELAWSRTQEFLGKIFSQ